MRLSFRWIYKKPPLQIIPLILYPLQKQRVARHALTGGGALTPSNYSVELVEGDAVTAYFHESADHGTHHIAEEAVGGDAEIPGIIAVGYPAGLSDIAKGGLHIGVTLAKSAKVGDVEQVGGGLVHQVEIERPVYLT